MTGIRRPAERRRKKTLQETKLLSVVPHRCSLPSFSLASPHTHRARPTQTAPRQATAATRLPPSSSSRQDRLCFTTQKCVRDTGIPALSLLLTRTQTHTPSVIGLSSRIPSQVEPWRRPSVFAQVLVPSLKSLENSSSRNSSSSSNTAEETVYCSASWLARETARWARRLRLQGMARKHTSTSALRSLLSSISCGSFPSPGTPPHLFSFHPCSPTFASLLSCRA